MGSLIEAMRMYRRDRSVLLLAAVMTVGVHCLLTVGMWMIARGLPGNVPPLPHLLRGLSDQFDCQHGTAAGRALSRRYSCRSTPTPTPRWRFPRARHWSRPWCTA